MTVVMADTSPLTVTTIQVHREKTTSSEVTRPFHLTRANQEGTDEIDEEQVPARTAPRDGSFGTDTCLPIARSPPIEGAAHEDIKTPR